MINKNERVLEISIVTVVFNCVDSIKDTIESIISQTYINIQYIVIDGGSTDGTKEEILKLKKYIDIFVSESDNGIYDAMNKALIVAQGDYVLFMNSGDKFYSNNTVFELVNKLKNKEAVYYGDAVYINNISKETHRRGGAFNKYRLAKINICHQTILYPKSIYKVYSYNLKYILFADWAMNIELFPKFKFIHLDQIIAYYDSNGVSVTNRDYKFEKDLKKIILKYLGFDCLLYLAFNKIRKLLNLIYI